MILQDVGKFSISKVVEDVAVWALDRETFQQTCALLWTFDQFCKASASSPDLCDEMMLKVVRPTPGSRVFITDFTFATQTEGRLDADNCSSLALRFFCDTE